jgi:hypothetical protein
MTHLPNITSEQALAVLLRNQCIQITPSVRSSATPMLEAVVGIGKDNQAYVSLQQEDIDALNAIIQTQQASPDLAQQPNNQTVRSELKDGNVIVLESRRAQPNSERSSIKERRDYALGELEPFIEMAKEGEIRCLVVMAELEDTSLSFSYPTGQWEPGLVAGALLLQQRLLDQG